MSITKVIEACPASELARRLSAIPDPATGRLRRVSPQAIAKWIKKDRIPADRCIAVEQVIDGAVTRYEMRPDVFGAAPPAKQVA
jgi:DNA-binding transcriptional regulator YdaS (Cro superfamily)